MGTGEKVTRGDTKKRIQGGGEKYIYREDMYHILIYPILSFQFRLFAKEYFSFLQKNGIAPVYVYNRGSCGGVESCEWKK